MYVGRGVDRLVTLLKACLKVCGRLEGGAIFRANEEGNGAVELVALFNM